MDGTQTRDRPQPALTSAYRAIRSIGPPEAPVAGTLAVCDDEAMLLADVAGLADWPGWQHVGAQHVLAPLDVARSAAGHSAVLPLCAEPLEVWLSRRLTRGPALAGGEVVTLVVSLLRGVQESWEGRGGEEDSPRGTWWLTEDARPVLALESGGRGAGVEEQAAGILARVTEGCTDRVLRRALDEADAVLRRPRALHRTSEPVEQKLFEACAPHGLGRASRDEGVIGAAPGAALRDGADRGHEERGESRAARMAEAIERHLDDGLGGILAGIVRELRERADRRAVGRHPPERRRSERHEPERHGSGGRGSGRRRSRRARAAHGRRGPENRSGRRIAAGGEAAPDETASGRRRGRGGPVLVGLVAAGAVLTAGMLWPDGGERGAGSAPRDEVVDEGAAPSPSRPAPSPGQGGPEHAVDDSGETGITGPVPGEMAQTGTDQAGMNQAGRNQAGAERAETEPAEEQSSASGAETPESATLRLLEAGPDAQAALIEDFGDVVVVRLDEGDAASRHVVLERGDGRWRLRQVYETAEGAG
jgi:hypothetical protein